MKPNKPCCEHWEYNSKTLDFYREEAAESWGKVAMRIPSCKPFLFCPWCGRSIESQNAVYDPNLKLPPAGVVESAKIVEGYFNENHPGNWEFMGLRNRFPK